MLVRSLHLTRLAVLLELALILAVVAVAIATQGPIAPATWLLLAAGPLLWIYAQILCWRTGYGRIRMLVAIVAAVLSLSTVLVAFGWQMEEWLSAGFLLGVVAMGSSLSFWQSQAFERDFRAQEVRFMRLWLVPVAAFLGAFLLPAFGLLLGLLVAVFWLAFYSSALHSMAMALEQE